MMTPIERARKYLTKCDPAISGQGGHDQTFTVACSLVNGFALTESDALTLLGEYNRACSPAWNESQLRHKIASAVKVQHAKPRGHLLGGSIRHTYRGTSAPQVESKPMPPITPQAPVTHYDLKRSATLPEPIADSTREFLRAAFLPGEGISIAQEVLNDEGKGVPKSHGITLSIEEWLKKLDAREGDPNKIFSSSDKTGAFIRINPMKLGGSKDSEVTSFRHALIEFDKISIEEQWNLIVQSQIPCTAVLHSGNRSLHAWVKVDAADAQQYAERVRVLYAHFADYGIDDKNKNPSRLSRLPGMIRGQKKQSLLALKTGAESFSAWQMLNDKSDLPRPIDLSSLALFDKRTDPNCILGDRWIGRAGSMMFIAQSGVGKSSMLMQMAITWSQGKSLFGVRPVRPLRILIIQAENDDGDMAEMFQGVIEGMQLANSLEDLTALVNKLKHQIFIISDTTHTGEGFASHALRLIDEYKPDIVMADPMLAYVGDDVSGQKVCSHFFRTLINPISKSTGVAWLWFHHTGKPEKDSRMRKNWTSNDYAYIGAGSAELTNFARATCYLKQASKDDEGLFELIFAKRGKRAGATDLQGNRSNRIWLKHGDTGICWKQVNPPEETEEKADNQNKKGGRTGKAMDYDGFAESIKHEHLNASRLVERASKFSGIGESTIYSKHLTEIKKRLKYDEETESFSC